MTHEIDRDNEDWLLGLSGEPRPDADKYTNAQAAAVRNALSRRATALDQVVPEASEAGYHRLLFRLKREGLLKPRVKQAGNQASFFSKPLAIAAVFFLGAIVVFHSYQINEESEEVLYKGSSGQTVVRVADPEATATGIASALKSQQIEFQLIDLPRRSKQLVIPSSAEAIKVLEEFKIRVSPEMKPIDILIEIKR